MFYPKSPKRTDKSINYDMLLNLFNQSKKLQNIRFDPNHFYTQQDPSGMYVTMNAQEGGDGTEFNYHFKVEESDGPEESSGTESEALSTEQDESSNNSIYLLIRGGYWIKDGDSLPLLCDEGDYTGDYDADYWTEEIEDTGSDGVFINVVADPGSGDCYIEQADHMGLGVFEMTIAWVLYEGGSVTINQYIVGDVISGTPENDHSWHCNITSDTTATVTEGLCFLGGVQYAINGFNPALTGITSDKKYWIELHRDGSTPTTMYYWASGTAWPASSDVLEIYPILEFTTSDESSSEEGYIVDVVEHCQSDIHDTLMC